MFISSSLWGEKASAGMSKWTFGGYTYDVFDESLQYTCMYKVLAETARKTPDAIAFEDNWGHTCTFREFLDKTDGFAQYLHDRENVGHGDYIGVMLYNSIEFCAVYFALSKLGAVLVSLPTKFHKEEVKSLAEKASVKGIICNNDFADFFEEEKAGGSFLIAIDDGKDGYSLPSCAPGENGYTVCTSRPEDVAIIIFTSGTTSRSKGAVLRNFNVINAVIGYQRAFRLTPEDRTITPTPMYHITGMIAILSLFVYLGAKTYFVKKFDPGRIMDIVKREKITFIHSTPTVFILLLEQRIAGEKIDCIRMMACGSSNMPVEKIKELHDWMPNLSFRTVYGLSETTSLGTEYPCDAATSPYIGSSGVPAPGTVFAIWDDKGNEVPNGQYGEVMAAGAVVITEYLGEDYGLIEDHWLHTGDIGYFNDEGYIWIVDRKKDMINYGGEKVPSFDIENAIYDMPQVREVAVVGVKDERYGEVVAAAVDLHDGASLTAEEIQSFLKPRLAKFKIPKLIVFMPVPKTENNKINKKLIREQLNAIYQKNKKQ